MKNNFFLITVIIFIFNSFEIKAGELDVNASKILFNNNTKITILEGNVSAVDSRKNKIYSEFAEYDKFKEYFVTTGRTKIFTAQGYEIESSNIIFDNKKNIITSKDNTIVFDPDGNKIEMQMFKYFSDTGIFFSKGNIEIIDINKNNYIFSEIYIDQIKRKIVGSDVKFFLKQKGLTANNSNEPRFFANTLSLSDDVGTFDKGIFTYCKNRGEDKCPPWTLQAQKIKHNPATKTIYYDNAILKVYDFPIFYFPKFSHPDPTVKRKSGFLVPSFHTNSTLGSGLNMPYFWAISNDKDLTLSPKLYLQENPLLLAEFRQDFKNSNLIVDTGYNPGYKKKTKTKTKGARAHFFSRFNINFENENNIINELEFNLQKVSNDTYFKIHDINTSLVDDTINILDSNIDYSFQNDDYFFGANVSVFEDLNKDNRDRYEYLAPITFEKNIISGSELGFVDLKSNIRFRNYDVNKQTEFFVNDFNWKSNKWLSKLGLENNFEGLIKTSNYKASNTSEFKTQNTNSEVSGVIALITKLGLYKNDLLSKNIYSLTPKVSLRFAPGHMRDIDQGANSLKYSNLFNLTKLNEIDVIENGLSTAIGFNFKKNEIKSSKSIGKEKLSFSLGQVINDRENSDMPSNTSLDQRFSDVVGESSFSMNDSLKLKYNFSVDQNYREFNYNEVGAEFTNNRTKFNISYLEESNHVGNQEYVKSDINVELNSSNALNFSTKRNLLTNSAEFYNLSYNYINDCLKAGIAYRREFYTDRDVEPNNSLMFTISIVPFADINSPSFR